MHWEGEGQSRKLVDDPPYERSISQLWAYCGHGDPDRQRYMGMDATEAFALGRPKLKMLVHLIAECAIRQPGATTPDSAMAQTNPMGISLNREQLADSPNAHRIPTTQTTVSNPFHPGQSRDETQWPAAGVELSPDPAIQLAEPSCGALDQESLGMAMESKDRSKSNLLTAPWPYRFIYDQRREATLDRLHQNDCRRCGPSGKPALSGTPWSRAHQHADALRIVGKAILRDLWLAADA